ncbi:hypothetical protein AWV79_24300 [Cupriavidus sp. UYMMa02A]|nr:hypothetical protein AWV79_24300 [Cupriavidus sp. UYMMa02A]
MKKTSTEGKLLPSRRVSIAWPPFARKLAGVLQKLEEDQYLILSVKRSNQYVQFAAQGSFGMRAETTSSSYLVEPEQLNARQIAALLDAGWHAPTGTPAESTPADDPDGSPNFFLDFSAPVSFDAVANLAVRTLAGILLVPHPGFLEYDAFGEDGEAIALPDLGLRRAVRARPVDNREGLSMKLQGILREITGISELTFDSDGDLGFRSGSAVAFVRLMGDPPYVCIHSPILGDVEEGPGLLARLNDMNAEESLLRFIFKNGMIYCIAYISVAPFVKEQLSRALEHFCTVSMESTDCCRRSSGGRLHLSSQCPV